jgi:uncharacterized glyoxalase superfamily protein PhnB
MPQCCPYLFYDDTSRAIDFLVKAFGFTPRFVDKNDEGAIHHAQLAYGSGVVMMGRTNEPRALRSCRNPIAAGSMNAHVYLFVDDVDDHARRARDAGAEVVFEPADMPWGDRIYCAVDPEGQFWCFATRTSDGAADH